MPADLKHVMQEYWKPMHVTVERPREIATKMQDSRVWVEYTQMLAEGKQAELDRRRQAQTQRVEMMNMRRINRLREIAEAKEKFGAPETE